jgi:hypothetical protein
VKRLFLVSALLAVLVAMPAAPQARSKSSVTVTRVSPLIVKGAHFVAGERVKIVVRVPRMYRKTLTAGRQGRFTAMFRVAIAKCTTIQVVATGNKGSRASATVPPSCTV